LLTTAKLSDNFTTPDMVQKRIVTLKFFDVVPAKETPLMRDDLDFFCGPDVNFRRMRRGVTELDTKVLS
jgi:hypothetical protein